MAFFCTKSGVRIVAPGIAIQPARIGGRKVIGWPSVPVTWPSYTGGSN